MYALITGFLEQGEEPEAGVLREVSEELGLQAEVCELVGVYSFFQKNQVIIAYHVRATGTVRLNEELRAWRCVAKGDLTYWDAATGYALRDWLRRQGYEPELRPLR
jgi:NAD+ diphosphatase